MLKRLRDIMTYYDSEPTEVLQGLIWLIFFPIVIMSELSGLLLYLVAPSIIIGFVSILGVAKSCIKTRLYSSYAYGIFSVIAAYVFISNGGLKVHATNLGWIVICISAVSNIRRVRQKYFAEMSPSPIEDSTEVEHIEEDMIDKMYRDDLKRRIEDLQRENVELRFKNAELQSKNLE